MARYLIARGTKQSDRQAALELVKSEGGQQIEIHPLGTIVECSADIAEALELVPILDTDKA